MITVTKHKFIEQFREILLKVVEEGETIEITDNGEVIAHVVPAKKPKQLGKRDIKTSQRDTDRLAAKISAYSPEKVDAVKIIREMRRDL